MTLVHKEGATGVSVGGTHHPAINGVVDIPAEYVPLLTATFGYAIYKGKSPFLDKGEPEKVSAPELDVIAETPVVSESAAEPIAETSSQEEQKPEETPVDTNSTVESKPEAQEESGEAITGEKSESVEESVASRESETGATPEETPVVAPVEDEGEAAKSTKKGSK